MKVLILAYYFPPDSSSGSFRPLLFSKHLNHMGVDIHVITAREENYLKEQTMDHALLSLLPDDIRITRCTVHRPYEALISVRDRIRRKAITSKHPGDIPKVGLNPLESRSTFQHIKDFITEIFSTPDRHIGWIPDCVRRGKNVIRTEKPDLIFATGGPWSGMLAAARLKKASGLPLIVDFRDPWYSNPARRSRNFQHLDRLLEEHVVNLSDAVIVNTEELRADFLKRYPKLSYKPVITITNGFENYLPVQGNTNSKILTLTHTGSLYFSRNPLNLLQAILKLISSGFINRNEFKLQFVGGIEINDRRLSELLFSEGLKDIVETIPRVPYAESMRYIQKADALLLVQPDFPLQIPRKLFEYMAVRKPMFCIVERYSATANLIRKNQLGYVSEDQTSEIVRSLRNLIDDWRDGRLSQLSSEKLDKFRNEKLTEILLSQFRLITLNAPTSGRSEERI